MAEGNKLLLSDTTRGRKWLANFAPADRELAKNLLDNMTLVSWTTARGALKDLTEKICAQSGNAGPIWVIPVLDQGDIRKDQQVRGLAPSASPTAFVDFSPGMPIASEPGSEGLVGHMLRDVRGKGILRSSTTLDVLREKRVRTLLLVTDLVESGGQVAKYLAALFRNPTLRSWRSFGWIRVVVAAYSVSLEGQAALDRNPLVDSLEFVRVAPTVHTLPWAKEEIDSALKVCQSYGGKSALGYGSHAGLFGFQDRVPNTLPWIFRMSRQGWAPLFENRQVPTDLIDELSPEHIPTILPKAVPLLRKQSHTEVAMRRPMRESNRVLMSALAELNTTRGDSTRLAYLPGMDHKRLDRLVNYLRSRNWVADSGVLSTAGKAELRASKRAQRHVAPFLHPTTQEPYYPWSVR